MITCLIEKLVLLVLLLMVLCYCSKSTINRSISPKPTKSKGDINQIYQALQYYKDKNNGSLKIPYSYTIPHDLETISMNINNISLGKIASRIRNRGDFKEHHDTLEKIGLKLTTQSGNYSKVINAIKIYYQKYNDTNIKAKYIVGDDWPEKYRGMHLGSQVDHLRRKRRQMTMSNDNKVRRKDSLVLTDVDVQTLNDINFNFQLRKRLNGIDLLNILVLYKSIHGNCLIPSSYVIPNETPWPVSLHGWKLGQRISHIRSRGDFKVFHEALDDLGFPWDIWRDKEFQHILSALADYKKSGTSSRFTQDEG